MKKKLFTDTCSFFSFGATTPIWALAYRHKTLRFTSDLFIRPEWIIWNVEIQINVIYLHYKEDKVIPVPSWLSTTP
jgi:hypothetical protein